VGAKTPAALHLPADRNELEIEYLHYLETAPEGTIKMLWKPAADSRHNSFHHKRQLNKIYTMIQLSLRKQKEDISFSSGMFGIRSRSAIV